MYKNLNYFLYILYFFLLFCFCTSSILLSNTDDLGNITSTPPQAILKKISKAGVEVKVSSFVIGEKGEKANISVRLKSKPISNIILLFKSEPVDEALIMPNEIIFTPNNWDEFQTVAVIGQKDYMIDGDQIFKVVLSIKTVNDFNYLRLNLEPLIFTNKDKDEAGFLVSSSSPVVSENQTKTIAMIQLKSKPTSSVELVLQSQNRQEGVLENKNFLFTPENWNKPQKIIVIGKDDFDIDGKQNFLIRSRKIKTKDTDYAKLPPLEILFTNEDNDTADIVLSKVKPQTSEQGQMTSVNVKLNSRPRGEVFVFIFSSNEKEGIPKQEFLKFNSKNWNKPQQVQITGLDDSIIDGNQRYTIQFVSKSRKDKHYENIKKQIQFINLDDDTSGVDVSLSENKITESGDSIQAFVKLHTKPTHTVEISVSSTDEEKVKFNPEKVTFTPENWNQEQVFEITGIDDGIVSLEKSITILFSSIQGNDPFYNQMAPAKVVVSHQDNDSIDIQVTQGSNLIYEKGEGGYFKVRLNSKPKHPVTLNLSNTDITEATLSKQQIIFDTTNWNQEQLISVLSKNDDENDGNQVFQIILHPLISKDKDYDQLDPINLEFINVDNNKTGFSIGSYNGNTTEFGGTISIPIWLNTKPISNVSIEAKSLNLKEGIVVTKKIIFTPENWNQPQNLEVQGIDDFFVDKDQTYEIMIQAMSESDPNFMNLTPKKLVLLNKDNDQIGIIVNQLGRVTNENGGKARFKIRLKSSPIAPLIIPLLVSDTTEAKVIPSFVLFNQNNWDQEQLVEVVGVDDSEIDGNQNFQVMTSAGFSRNDPEYDGITFKPLTFLNQDLDTPGLSVITNYLNTTESGGSIQFFLTLNTKPKENVRIYLKSSNENEGTVSPTEIIFTPLDWEKQKVITVTGVNDRKNDDDVIYKILISSTFSKDSNYNNIESKPVFLKNLDFIRNSIGISLFQTDANGSLGEFLNPGLGYGITYFYSWIKNIEWGGSLLYARLEGEQDEFKYHFIVNSLQVNVRYQILLEYFKIYPEICMGAYHFSSNVTRDTTESAKESGNTNFGICYGMGLQKLFGESLGLNLQLQQHLILKEFQNTAFQFSTLMFNFQYSF